jgi:hypothetical protein
VRGGPERTRTPGTQFYRTSLCHCPNVASAGASRRRKSSLRRCEPNQDRWRCTVRLDPAIKHRRTAQRHCREKAGNPLRLERLVLSSVSGRQGRSEILPRRLDRRGGASVVRRPPRTERRRSYRVATWWRYRLEYRKRQIGLVRNLTQSQYVIGATVELLTPRFAVWCFRRWCHARTSSCVQGNDARPPRRVGRLRRAGGSGATENSIGAFKQTQTPAPVC